MKITPPYPPTPTFLTYRGVEVSGDGTKYLIIATHTNPVLRTNLDRARLSDRRNKRKLHDTHGLGISSVFVSDPLGRGHSHSGWKTGFLVSSTLILVYNTVLISGFFTSVHQYHGWILYYILYIIYYTILYTHVWEYYIPMFGRKMFGGLVGDRSSGRHIKKLNGYK